MSDDLSHARRQLDAVIRERRRGLYRTMAGIVIVSAVAALALAGVMTWMGQP